MSIFTILEIENFYKSNHALWHSRRYWKKKFKFLKPTHVFIINFGKYNKDHITEFLDYLKAHNLKYNESGVMYFVKASDADIIYLKMLMSE